MERWEIKRKLEELEPEEQEKFVKSMLEQYKIVKKQGEKSSLIGAGVGLAGIVMMATGICCMGDKIDGALGVSGLITFLTGVLTTFGGAVGFMKGNFSPSDYEIEASKEAKKQIKELKDMYKMVRKESNKAKR